MATITAHIETDTGAHILNAQVPAAAEIVKAVTIYGWHYLHTRWDGPVPVYVRVDELPAGVEPLVLAQCGCDPDEDPADDGVEVLVADPAFL